MTDATPIEDRMLRLPRPLEGGALTLAHYRAAGWVGVEEESPGVFATVLGPDSGLAAVQCDPSDQKTVRESEHTFAIRDRKADTCYLLFRHPGRGFTVRRTRVTVKRTRVEVLPDGHRLRLPSPAGNVGWVIDPAKAMDHVHALDHVTVLPTKYGKAVEGSPDLVTAVRDYLSRHPEGVSRSKVDQADEVGGTRRERRQAVEALLSQGLAQLRHAEHVEGASARLRPLLFLVANFKSSRPPHGGEVEE